MLLKYLKKKRNKRSSERKEHRKEGIILRIYIHSYRFFNIREHKQLKNKVG